MISRGLDGWEFVDRIRKDSELAGIPVVIMSAFRGRPPPSGTAGSLKKPANLGALLAVVTEHYRDEAKQPATVTQTGELTPLAPEEESTASYTPWRMTQPHQGEALRWECIDGRWISITIGSGEKIGTVVVRDSAGVASTADSYEGALELAKQWQRR